jgi:glycopeptide antibiotics resistance protein
MRRLIILVLIFFCVETKAQLLDYNTISHTTAGVTVGVTTTVLIKNNKRPILVGFASALVIGSAKEIYDLKSKTSGKFQVQDLVFTAIGGLAGSSLAEMYRKRKCRTNRLEMARF